jgi:hypothetical protein
MALVRRTEAISCDFRGNSSARVRQRRDHAGCQPRAMRGLAHSGNLLPDGPQLPFMMQSISWPGA